MWSHIPISLTDPRRVGSSSSRRSLAVGWLSLMAAWSTSHCLGSGRTSALVAHLRRRGILATGLNYPVVPKGEEEIRFQISADHTPADIDEVLDALRSFGG